MRAISTIPLAIVAACTGPIGYGRQSMRANLFVSPMGEPFRSAQRGTDLVGQWFAGADRDGDQVLRLAEMEQDAARFFALLDLDRDGEIDPVEMEKYETVILPEVRVSARFGGGPSGGGPGGGSAMGRAGGRAPSGGAARGPMGRQGAALFGLLGYPQPVAAADANFNRGVSGAEFAVAAGQRFVQLDRNRDGKIGRDELVPTTDSMRPGRPPPR